MDYRTHRARRVCSPSTKGVRETRAPNTWLGPAEKVTRAVVATTVIAVDTITNTTALASAAAEAFSSLCELALFNVSLHRVPRSDPRGVTTVEQPDVGHTGVQHRKSHTSSGNELQ